MPNRHFLTNTTPLAQQVAEWLLGETSGSAMQVVTPTAGAGRQITAHLKAMGGEAPSIAQPMQALLPESEALATPVERALAWSATLSQLPSKAKQALFWNRFPETTAEQLKAARNFIRLADRLAEAGLSPDAVELSESNEAGFDTGRWAAIAELYSSYLRQLDAWQREDPNAVRIHEARSPSTSMDRLIIVGVSDLPRIFEQYAEALERAGAQVNVLIWNPSNEPTAAFDTWGRPEPDVWSDRRIPIKQEQITVAASTQDEARAATVALTTAPSGIVVVDPKLQSAVASEILLQGRQPYLPEGENLIRCEAAQLALEWEEFRQSKDLRRLRRLVELPAFCRALDPENPISQTDALIAIDHLLGKAIATTLDAGWAASPALPDGTRDYPVRAKVRRLLGSVQARLDVSALSLIEAAYPEADGERPKSADRVLFVGRQLEASPALEPWTRSKKNPHLPTQIFSQAIRQEQIQSPAQDNDVTLHGWLEAPWLPAEQLVLCGLIEGQLPKAVDGDPFLPDSVCPQLGLTHNRQRLARDAYLLHALIAARPTDKTQLSFSKYNSDSDPNRPSRLLLRTPLDTLPQRIEHITQPAASKRTRPTRQTAWRWQLPRPLPTVSRISPTQFEAYLSCPFRYCLKHVLRLDSGPRAAHEMDAAVFGNLIHQTLENFANEVIPMGEAMRQLDAARIHERVQALLQDEATAQFGSQPAPAVQIQIANAAARLHAFARVQAKTFEDGWIILAAERRLEADGDNPLKIGPLHLSGIIDRIERHAETGALRIMDYKTFSSPEKPVKTHLAPPSHNWLEAALVELPALKRAPQKSWSNLQLPLYRRILEHWYPDQCAAHPPETAYFLLPSDPNETAITPFEELDAAQNPEAYASALTCAEAVAESIHAGVFWPPQPFRSNWDDPAAPIFINGAPEDCVAPESIEQLKGGAR